LREAVSNPIDSITASIAWVGTMVKNILEHGFKEVYYPIRNTVSNYWYALRHPIETTRLDSFALLPKAVAAPFAGIASAVTGWIRSILETPEDLSRGLWQTPIDAATAGTVWQLWLPGRLLHYAWKVISTPPRVFFHYTTSLLGRWIDIVWDTIAKLTHFDATPESWKRYVTPSTISFNNIWWGDTPVTETI
jgi:hypothetical protein